MWILNSKLRHLKFCLSCFDFIASFLLCLHLLCRRYFCKTGELCVLENWDFFFPQHTIEISFCSVFCPCNNSNRRQRHCSLHFYSFAVMPLLWGMLWKAYHILFQCLGLIPTAEGQTFTPSVSFGPVFKYSTNIQKDFPFSCPPTLEQISCMVLLSRCSCEKQRGITGVFVMGDKLWVFSISSARQPEVRDLRKLDGLQIWDGRE